jgi:stage V sporulation protein R
MKTGISAREKTIPEVILRSPKPVVAAFLRALYDCDGYAGSEGVILATSSAEMSKLVQLLLLNFGIMSTRRPHKDGCWHVHTTGASCAYFLAQIGFELERKQAALAAYIESRRWFKREAWTDEVVSIEHGRGDVYDISVTETHRYVAQGFINHNSYWHSTIMTQKAASAAEIVSFADLHSGVVATSSGRYNPYKVGLELLRDVEDRWNKGKFGKEYDECDDIAEKRNWDKQLGLGRQKIFEIRRLYNDVTFIDEFLTPEFVVENKLFTFRYNRDTDLYEIASREFKEIKEKLLFRLTNFGQPFIYVEDGNYNNRGEMYLRHRHEGVDLKMDYARDTMRNLYKIWTRPIHLETLIDDKKRLLSFDGSDFTERRID